MKITLKKFILKGLIIKMIKEVIEFVLYLLTAILFTALSTKITYKETARLCTISSFVWWICVICKFTTMIWF